MKMHGLHDREGAQDVPPGGWCLDTIALSENPQPVDYHQLRPDINWIVRINWGYGSTGTLPSSSQYREYVGRAIDWLRHSKNYYGYICGNEPNHEQERPNGQVIKAKDVAWIFSEVNREVRTFNPSALAITTPIAPYHADPMDWTEYLKEMLHEIDRLNSVEGIGIGVHAYLRSSDPASASSEEKMGAPLEGQYSDFRTYRDALTAVPFRMRNCPAFITEISELLEHGWHDQNTGVVQAVYKELEQWNRDNITRKVLAGILYRWPHYDKWHIEGKTGVIQDFGEASKGNQGTVNYLPGVVAPQPVPVPDENGRDIDPRALARGVQIQPVLTTARKLWKVTKLDWLDEQESQGRHHIYFDTLAEDGARLVGVDIIINWPDGTHTVTSEAKPGEPYSANFPMSPSRNEFSATVLGTFPSETVTGIGMGAMTPSGYNAGVHTSTFIQFQLKPRAVPVAPQPPIDGGTPTPPGVPLLVHPIIDPQFRKVTQVFGINEQNYGHLIVGGVHLKGHNGIDFGTPVGIPIRAVADGVAVEVLNDAEGYGLYIKVVHPWGESLYAHLSKQLIKQGEAVRQGQTIGITGNTGYSTGPHFHFALRVNPYNRSDGFGGYSDPSPYLGEQPKATYPPQVLETLKTAASETGLEWQLLASLAWAESSFRPELEDGLFQIGDMAWNDWADSVSAINKNRPIDNARVGAVYLKWLLAHFEGDFWKALYAWNWGIGNVESGGEPPAITKTFANKVIHGRDLLKAIEG